MTIMNQTKTDLVKAFDQFNLVSGSLSSSFNQLNATVSNLADAYSLPVQEQVSMTQHLRALLDAIPGAVIVINSNGQVVDFNRAAKELLGEPLAETLWRDVVQRVFLSELDQGELRTETGQQFSISTRPLGYEPGQILLLSDVTQTRKLQRAAQQNLHLMTMGKMMASLAHQIRTPLSSSMLYLSQIVDGQLDHEKSQKFTTKALARIKHIEKMINDMLVFAHGGQFHTSDFAVADLLSELSEQLQPQLSQHQAELCTKQIDSSLLINGNKDALLGAMANLCMNALDAAESNLTISIKVDLTERGDLLIQVADNGSGMDGKILEHLFDPFFTTKLDGTGLGLAVVKSVIESHQGRVSVESTAGEGTRFDIHLPCLQGNRTQLSQAGKEETKND
jgi:two-component system sensor histidine kinase FlrB